MAAESRVGSLSGQEPALGDGRIAPGSGLEPMLGGARRQTLDRALFWALLNFDDAARRAETIERVIDTGSARFYAGKMAAVLAPGARYYEVGRLWKVPYSDEHKLAAMDSLAKLDPARALGGLVMALGHDDASLQRAAIWKISQLDADDAERVLLAILEDDRAEIRHPATQALGRRWDEPQVARLVNLHGTVVREAAGWLGEYGPARDLAPLVAALKDRRRGIDNHNLALCALIRAVGRLGQRFGEGCGERVIGALRGVLDDRQTSPLAAREAIRMLFALGTQDAQAAAIVYRSSRAALLEL